MREVKGNSMTAKGINPVNACVFALVTAAAMLPNGAPAESLPKLNFIGTQPAVDEAFIGVRVLKTKGAGDLDWTAELPPECSPCRLQMNEKTSAENPKEFYFHFFMPGALDKVRVRVKVDPKKVRGVVTNRNEIPFTKIADGIVFDVPRHMQPEGGEPALFTYIETTGVRTRIEHADEERRYGPYATGPWPELQRQAALNLEFGAREAINALGLDRTMQDRGLGVIQLMGFDTNNPTLGPDQAHGDSPPHWHMHVYWGGSLDSSFVVPHFYIDEQGLLTHNKVAWKRPPTNDAHQAQKTGRYERGQTHETLTPTGEVLFTHTITAEGYFEFAAAGGKCLLAPVGNGFQTGVDVRCDNGAPARQVRAEDELDKGRLRLFVNKQLADEYLYDTDTFALKRSLLTHER
jgi:hypothetical protein